LLPYTLNIYKPREAHNAAPVAAWRAARAKIAAHWRNRCQPRWKSDLGIPAAQPHLGTQALQAHSTFKT
jgi:hypothetical protein